ncbi:AI-2E family transporter [Candidatus Nomurabacteria bacterium]|nr:AI-2E family transporter [Candidatus Nomurabacteria bacterium]
MKQKSEQPIVISITSGAIIKTIVILLGLYLIYVMRDLVLVILTAIVIASAIEPGTKWFVKKRIPRLLSVILIYLLVVLIFAGIFAVFLPPLINDFSDLAKTFPQYIKSLTESQASSLDSFFGLIYEGSLTSDIFAKISSTFSGATVGFLSTASNVFGGLLSFVLIIVISFYLAVQENGVENFIRIVTPVDKEKYVMDLWRRSQRKIGLWMQGQLVLALIVGLLTYLGLSILGISNPMFLAVIAAIFELIPIFGPILAAIPAIAFALLDGGITLGFLTAGLYVIIQQFESQLIHPLVVRKIVGIPALVAIIAIIIGATVAGFLGIIISVPVAAAVMEFLSDVEKKKRAEHKALES